MNILIVSQYFWPESFRINDLALGLKERGHNVTVLTGKPNYPEGKFFKGYSFFNNRDEFYEGIRIIRVPILPRGNGSGIRLGLNYLSFVFAGLLRLVKLKKEKFDIQFIFEISPITMAIPAIFYKYRTGTPIMMWVQDLWPEVIKSSGGISNKFIYNLILKLTIYIYDKCDILLTQSNSIKDNIESKIGRRNNIKYLPNWAESLFLENEKSKNEILPIIPDGFIIMFAGNIGVSQDFPNILNAMDQLRDLNDLKLIVLGDGRNKKWVEEQILIRSLTNVILMGRFPVVDMPFFYSKADVMLLTLKKDDIFSMIIPSKLQSYMAAGKPILSMIDGEGNRVIKNAKCGLVSNSEDFIGLSNNIRKVYKMNSEQICEMGKNGRKYYLENFDRNILIDQLVMEMKSFMSNV